MLWGRKTWSHLSISTCHEKEKPKDHRTFGNWLAQWAPLALRHQLALGLLFYTLIISNVIFLSMNNGVFWVSYVQKCICYWIIPDFLSPDLSADLNFLSIVQNFPYHLYCPHRYGFSTVGKSKIFKCAHKPMSLS